MKILFAANEVHPVYKLGGLGDVIGSLPKELNEMGTDVRIVIPFHQEIKTDSTQIGLFQVTYNQRIQEVSLYQTFVPHTQIPLYLIYNQEYLSTSTDASDNHADKYAFFSLAVSHLLHSSLNSWRPEIVHLHDWHTALIPLIIKHKFANENNLKFLLTIHNLAYQASTSTPVHTHLGLDKNQSPTLTWDYQDGNINILMEGILHADLVNTVSPTYAKEIFTPEYSFGLDHVLHQKNISINGILNGLDYQDFNPELDPYITQQYRSDAALEGKQANKKQLLKSLNLSISDSSLLLSFIGRVDPVQKGIPLIIQAISQNILPPNPHQFIFLGTGDVKYEQLLREAATNHDNIKIITRFDEALARNIYAASDLMIIPSTYEPCGLVQMIAMSYGAIPLAHQTGGLTDTISHTKNGFLYTPQNLTTFTDSLKQALHHLHDQNNHRTMIHQAMSTKFYWLDSAKQYIKLYRQLHETQAN